MCVAVCCSVLQCVAVCCSVLQCLTIHVLSALHASCEYSSSCEHVCVHSTLRCSMGWLRPVGSIQSKVSFAKEPYKRDYILQKRPIILSNLLTVATPSHITWWWNTHSTCVYTNLPCNTAHQVLNNFFFPSADAASIFRTCCRSYSNKWWHIITIQYWQHFQKKIKILKMTASVYRAHLFVWWLDACACGTCLIPVGAI